MSIKLEYIFHSGVLVEGPDYMVLIDYYRGDLPKFDKNTYIISTHNHRDHFNPAILDLEGDIDYILSSDIRDMGIEEGPNIHFVNPDQILDLGPASFETFGSTDQGISILINIGGVSIYHAGDLNLWIWPEDTDEERAQMEADFKAEVDKVKGKSIDIAMFPVDSRLNDRAEAGARYFLDKVKPKYFVPIHMTKDESYAVEISKSYSKIKFFIPKEKNQDYIVSL